MLTFNNVYNKLSSSHISACFQHPICSAYVTNANVFAVVSWLSINGSFVRNFVRNCWNVSVWNELFFTSSGIFVDACCDSPHEQDHNFLKLSQLRHRMLNGMSHQCDVFSYRASRHDYSSSDFEQNPENLSFIFNSLYS